MTRPPAPTAIDQLLEIVPLRMHMIPVESIVLMFIDHDDCAILTYRARTTAAEGEPERIAAVARRAGARRVDVVVVADHTLDAALATLDRFADALGHADIDIAHAVRTPRLENGAAWFDLLSDDYRTGTVTIPDSTIELCETSDTIEQRYTILGDEADPRHCEAISSATHFGEDSIAALQWVLDRDHDPDDTLIASIGLLAARGRETHAAVLAVGATNPAAAARLFATFAQRLRGIRRVVMLATAATMAAIEWRTTEAAMALTAAYDYAVAEDTVPCDWLPVLDTALVNAARPHEIHRAVERAVQQAGHLLPDAQRRLILLADDLGIDDEEFDEYVHDIFSRQASSINNRGRSAQIALLLDVLGPGETFDIIKTLADNLDAEPSA